MKDVFRAFIILGQSVEYGSFFVYAILPQENQCTKIALKYVYFNLRAAIHCKIRNKPKIEIQRISY